MSKYVSIEPNVSPEGPIRVPNRDSRYVHSRPGLEPLSTSGRSNRRRSAGDFSSQSTRSQSESPLPDLSPKCVDVPFVNGLLSSEGPLRATDGTDGASGGACRSSQGTSSPDSDRSGSGEVKAARLPLSALSPQLSSPVSPEAATPDATHVNNVLIAMLAQIEEAHRELASSKVCGACVQTIAAVEPHPVFVCHRSQCWTMATHG